MNTDAQLALLHQHLAEAETFRFNAFVQLHRAEAQVREIHDLIDNIEGEPDGLQEADQ
jgi:hypothetical protein